MANRIGRFVLRVSGDSSDLSRDLRKSGNDVENYAKTWSRAANLISAAIAGIAIKNLATGFVGVFQSASDSINDLLNFSDVTNTAISDIQSLELAGSRIGINPESIRDLIKDVNERISEAVTLDSGEGKDVLDILGLDSAELLAKSTFDRFVQLGQAIGNVGNRATQLQLIRQLSGSADEALRLFNNIQQINDARQFIDDFNIGFDIGGIDAFRAAQREIADISAIVGSLRDQFVITVSPAVREFLELFKTDVVRDFIATTFAGLKNLDDFFAQLIARENEIRGFFGALGEDFTGFLSDVGQFGVRQVDLIFDRISERAAQLITDRVDPNDFLAFSAGPAQFFGRRLAQNILGGAEQVVQQEPIEFQFASTNGSAFERLSGLVGGVGEDIRNLFDVEESKKAVQRIEQNLVDPISKSLRDFAKEQVRSLQTPFDVLNEETRKLTLSLEAGLIDQGQFDLLSARVRDDFEQARKAARDIRAESGFQALRRGTAEAREFAVNARGRNAQLEANRRRAIAAQNIAINNATDSRDKLRKALEDFRAELRRQQQQNNQNQNQNDVTNFQFLPV